MGLNPRPSEKRRAPLSESSGATQQFLIPGTGRSYLIWAKGLGRYNERFEDEVIPSIMQMGRETWGREWHEAREQTEHRPQLLEAGRGEEGMHPQSPPTSDFQPLGR